MYRYYATYKDECGHEINCHLNSETESAARLEATIKCKNADNIDLVVMDDTGEPICYVANKKWGSRWVSTI